MYVGLPNPNILMPVAKMQITNLDKHKSITVLYNPQSYTRKKVVPYRPIPVLGADAPIVQFHGGGWEVLSFELFFDSVSAGSEVGGTFGDKLKFTGNSLLPTLAGRIDVRDYTKKVMELAYVDKNLHRPPELKVEWASLQFKGYLAECRERFVRFDEQGRPVRAFVSVSFVEHRDNDKLRVPNPLNSPDTTKYHVIRQGDALWSLAEEEYGDVGEWRMIADSNGLSNPRRLRAGETLVIPAMP